MQWMDFATEGHLTAWLSKVKNEPWSSMFWLLVLLVRFSETKQKKEKKETQLTQAALSSCWLSDLWWWSSQWVSRWEDIQLKCYLVVSCSSVWISVSVKSTCAFLYTPASATVTLAAWQHCSLSYQRCRGGLKQRGYKAHNQSLNQLFLIHVQDSFHLCWYTPVSRFNCLFNSTPRCE